MNRRPIEPLNAEERALAEQLARLGPHGEPSLSLDSRILSAAHEAVATPAATRKRHWPVGLGIAATTLLAVGLAWQLRTPDPGVREYGGQAEVAVTATPEPPAVTASPDTAPPPPGPLARIEADDTAASPSATTPAPARSMAPQPLAKTRPAAATEAAREARTQTQAHPAEPSPPAPPPAPSATAPAVVALEASAESQARKSEPVGPWRPSAAHSNSTLDSAMVKSDQLGRVADAETTAKIAAQREQARVEQVRSREAAAVSRSTEVRNRASQASADLQEAVPAKSNAIDAYAPPAGSSPARNALKRTDLQLPVSEDGKLEPDQWLERIRLRRDLGDRASATESLMRFKQSHPFQKVPADLQVLLEP